jgi:hypothetical protein
MCTNPRGVCEVGYITRKRTDTGNGTRDFVLDKSPGSIAIREGKSFKCDLHFPH